MDHDLKELFERELAGEPPTPAVDVGAEAIVRGTRLRRRRATLLTGGAGVGVAAVLAVAMLLGAPDRTGPAPVAASPSTAAGQRCVPVDQTFGLGRLDVSVLLTEKVTAAQRADVENALRTDPLVQDFVYEGREAAFKRFRELWRDEPERAKQTQPDHLPESFRVQLTDPSTRGAFSARFAGRPGVGDVDDGAAGTVRACVTGVPNGGR